MIDVDSKPLPADAVFLIKAVRTAVNFQALDDADMLYPFWGLGGRDWSKRRRRRKKQRVRSARLQRLMAKRYGLWFNTLVLNIPDDGGKPLFEAGRTGKGGAAVPWVAP